MVTSRSPSSSCKEKSWWIRIFISVSTLNGGGGTHKRAQSTLSYFSAVHKLIAVIDVGWRLARQSPGQRQTGGAAIIQMDQRHLGGI